MMARLQRDNKRRTKPWKAEIKVDAMRYYLGMFATEDEALTEEREFRTMMTGSPIPGHHNCECPSHGRSMVWR
jgi:hypothetical protein